MSRTVAVFLSLFLILALPSLHAQQIIAPGSERYTLPYDESRGVVSYADYLEDSLNSVVRIHNGQKDAKTGKLKFPGHGSGVIYDAGSGLIMTNQHVVEDSDLLLVELADGELVGATLVGADPLSDIAVVRTERALRYESVFIDTSTIRVGDLVFAVGYPERYDMAVSSGVISGLNRRGFYKDLNSMRIEDYIQTDAAINPGNSGGPLFDSRGRVIGINTWIHRDSDGLGFAVPGNVATAVARRLVRGDSAEPGWFGARVDSLYPNDAKRLGLKTLHGVIVLGVDANSPASTAGLREGDIITGAGGRGIADKYQFANFILLSAMGVSYSLYYSREGQPNKVQLTLTDRNGRVPSKTQMSGTNASTGSAGTAITQTTPDATVAPRATDFFGASIEDNNRSGVQITAVDVGSAAFSKGVKVGDEILRVNNRAVKNRDALLDLLTALKGRSAAYAIRRGSQTLNLIL